MTKSILVALFAACTFTSLAVADNLKIPKDDPAVSIKVPESWKPEETDRGYAIESPDQVMTIFLEVASPKGVKKILEESLDWLVNDQKVKVVDDSQKDSDFEVDGRKWSKVSWDANSKEWGPSAVGFLFTQVGKGKVLTVTYWITKKDFDKHMPTLDKILDSLKPIDD